MSRTSRIVPTLLSLALASCGESASPPAAGASSAATGTAGATSATGVTGATSATGSTGGAAVGTSATGSSGGATGGGSVGVTTGSGGSTGGAADTDASGSGGDPSRDASRTDAEAAGDARTDAPVVGADGGTGSCPPGAVICDDFEKYADGATNLGPDWVTYTYSGTVRVDTTKPRGGAKSLHVTTQQGLRRYADIMRETRNVELIPRKHYGRLMLWLTTIPQGAQHWGINTSSGPMVGFPDEMAKFGEGGMFGKLMSAYAQRARPMANGMYLVRAGGPENGDPGPEADCAVAAPTQTITPRRWVCWEWLFDGTADSASSFLWLDGQAMTEVDAVGFGKQCQGPGFNGKPMMANYRWESPRVFDKVIIGYEQYQDMPAQEAWIDDIVIGSQRVGCPAP